jgi:ADP-ribose pyrophosphatase YjhB (NUDIX family)
MIFFGSLPVSLSVPPAARSPRPRFHPIRAPRRAAPRPPSHAPCVPFNATTHPPQVTETAEAAATRELYEEIGVRVGDGAALRRVHTSVRRVLLPRRRVAREERPRGAALRVLAVSPPDDGGPRRVLRPPRVRRRARGVFARQVGEVRGGDRFGVGEQEGAVSRRERSRGADHRRVFERGVSWCVIDNVVRSTRRRKASRYE